MKMIQRFDDLLEKMSRTGLVVCLFGTLTLALTSIVLRWLGSSVNWIDPFVRHLVFLSAFLGGSVATKGHQHIRVDLLTKMIEWSNSKIINWVHRNLISLFCLVTTLAMVKSGWDFYLVEKEFGSPAMLQIHSSILVGIIPFGMGLIFLRFFNQLLIGSFGWGK